MSTEIATFAGGCFWGVESVFEQVPGVTATRVGYTGGHTEHPSYREVCSGRTGHAEALEVTFDPAVVTYEQLLHVFFTNHDPTQMNRQGPDVGTQYRSAVFTHSDEQARAAREAKERIDHDGSHRRPVVTEIVPAGPFWEAEEYHQKYFSRRGMVAACHL